jgi:type I restriction enzyme, S subunit
MTNLSGTNLNNGAAVGPQGEGRESPSNFPKYSAYKDSGVEWLGAVPEGWELIPFKYVAEFVNGMAFNPEQWSEVGIPIIRIENLNNGESFNYFEGTVEERYHVKTGDLLFGWSGNRGTSFGPFLWHGVGLHYLNQHIFRIADFRCDKKWLYWALKAVTKTIEDQAHGIIGMVHVTKGKLGGIKIPLLPHPEQTQIARFLDHETARIDALIEEQQRLIELLKEKRQAVISHAVTKGLDPTVPMKDSGVEWLGEVPAHWDVGALKHFISPVPGAIKTGPFGSHLKSEDMKEGPYKVFNQRSVIDADFSSGDNFISEEKFAELRGFTAFPGDVLVTTRGTIGRAAILPDNAEVGILHPCLLRVQVDESKITSSYLCRLIQESHLLKTQLSLMSNSTTIEVIYSETMANLLIPVPPITEQAQIAAFLNDVISKFGALTSDANESVRLLQERRSALISAAVTGKIDVRGWQPPASTQAPEPAVAEAD